MKKFLTTAAFLTLGFLSLKAQTVVPLGFSSAAGSVKTAGKSCAFRIGNTGSLTVRKTPGQEEIMTENRDIKPVRISAYPNPFTEEISIALPFPENGLPEIRFADCSGKVYACKGTKNRNGEISADTRSLKPGLYIMRVVSGNNVYTIKVVKL